MTPEQIQTLARETAWELKAWHELDDRQRIITTALTTVAADSERQLAEMTRERDELKSWESLTAEHARVSLEERDVALADVARLRETLKLARMFLIRRGAFMDEMAIVDAALSPQPKGGESNMPELDPGLTIGGDVPSEPGAIRSLEWWKTCFEETPGHRIFLKRVEAPLESGFDDASKTYERVFNLPPAAPAQPETHAPMAYETFVLMKRAVETQCEATAKALAELATAREALHRVNENRESPLAVFSIVSDALARSPARTEA